MKSERLFNILSEIDSELLADAENISPRKHRRPLRTIAAAASLFLILGTGSYLYNNRPDPSLPKLTIDFYENGGMGFSGYWAYDISELVNNNPWTEDCTLTHLPVFRNRHPVDGAGTLIEFDWEFMNAALTKVAGYLGINNLEITHDPDGISGPPVSAQAQGMYFRMYHPEVTEVFFDPLVNLPEEYQIAGISSTYEDNYTLAEYLLEMYPNLIPMENPTINIYGGDYSSDGTENWQDYSISFYDVTEDLTQNILNYNFNLTTFTPDIETGNLWIYRVYQQDLHDVIGYYPIISADEAQSLLCKGYYGTNVPEDFRGEEYIAKRELVYRNDIMQDIYVPYYLFYVELPQEYKKNGLKDYGLYYVPAIESKYIEDFPQVWNIHFN